MRCCFQNMYFWYLKEINWLNLSEKYTKKCCLIDCCKLGVNIYKTLLKLRSEFKKFCSVAFLKRDGEREINWDRIICCLTLEEQPALSQVHPFQSKVLFSFNKNLFSYFFNSGCSSKTFVEKIAAFINVWPLVFTMKWRWTRFSSILEVTLIKAIATLT